MKSNISNEGPISYGDFRKEVLEDYRLAITSRECSLLGRKEVLTGKAKFGIFGDGKELPQIAMAKAFRKGDFRSGYYRDQTFMMALGELTVPQFFAALYAHTDIEYEPMSSGRQMGGHYATHSLDEFSNWKDLTKQYNSTADISCTAGQMPRLLGVAQASKVYRNFKRLNSKKFSIKGNEISWGTIGDASTSEGVFFETINAAGVMQVPMIISIWDDEYGISVHQEYHTTKQSISEALKGFQRDEEHRGIEIIKIKGWSYPDLIVAYQNAAKLAREEHVPVMIHVEELTQPQGHSTSGSHERYKSKERLQWETDFDCNLKMREWIIEQGLSNDEELIELEEQIVKEVKDIRNKAWKAYTKDYKKEKEIVLSLLNLVKIDTLNKVFIDKIIEDLSSKEYPYRKDMIVACKKALRYANTKNTPEVEDLRQWIKDYTEYISPMYNTHTYTEYDVEKLNENIVKPVYSDTCQKEDGRIILRDNFEALFISNPRIMTFGEDSGKIGDVNQGLEGLQEKFGSLRIDDVGIREATIIGQGIGLALRGLRPIAEIQYLDYLTYALYTMSDDLASLHYRTAGKQVAPLIVRTRGHRLEGIFHAGSPMAGILGYLRGMYILVPRNMTQAAGFYNMMTQLNQPALIIESLNSYRLKERMPSNLGEFMTPLGQVETLREGTDITLVSYGSTLRIVEQAARELAQMEISCEVIDIQSLIPFDVTHDIAKSIQKTNRLLIVDEDVPGGGSAYILQNILEQQNTYQYLDSPPRTLTAKEHRTAYGTDGDYFSKPSIEDVFDKVYEIMREADPNKYTRLI